MPNYNLCKLLTFIQKIEEPLRRVDIYNFLHYIYIRLRLIEVQVIANINRTLFSGLRIPPPFPPLST